MICLKQTVLTVSALTPLMLVGPLASAEEKHEHPNDGGHRQHSAHVHGMSALNLALDGEEVHIELDSPAANIVGFEHAPSSESDHAALGKAVATLKDGDRLFRFNGDAGCRMETAKVTSELLDQEDEAHEVHERHAGGKSAKHSHEEEEGSEHSGYEGETHSDVEAAYHFECDEPGKLTQLTVELFEAFPGMEKLEVQYVIESKQGATALTATDHVVEF